MKRSQNEKMAVFVAATPELVEEAKALLPKLRSEARMHGFCPTRERRTITYSNILLQEAARLRSIGSEQAAEIEKVALG